MPPDAYNVKISQRAWELLRWAKLETGLRSYSDVIKDIDKRIQKRSQKLEHSLEDFSVDRHRIKIKIPADSKSHTHNSAVSKTILLQKDARNILFRLKVESNRSEYTFSDAIEFLVRESGVELPKDLKN